MERSPPNKPLKIVFFGLPLAAVLLAHDGHDVLLASFAFTRAAGLRRARLMLGHERVLIKPNPRDPALHARVRSLAPDLLVSWFWTNRLPMEIITSARLGGVGAHPSLLPRHRGPDPFFWAIASGDEETGVTVHRLEAEYDTGEILAQERLAIDPSWDAWRLARALDRPSLRQLRATVLRFARGEALHGTPQDPALATFAPTPDEEAAAIRWTWPTRRVLRHVRALAPAPGAWTEVDGAVLTVVHAAPAATYPGMLAPGEGVVEGDRVLVRTADGAVELLRCEIDGVPVAPSDVRELFLSRSRLG
jgi:methionyl-tRNA formyltransferase